MRRRILGAALAVAVGVVPAACDSAQRSGTAPATPSTTPTAPNTGPRTTAPPATSRPSSSPRVTVPTAPAPPARFDAVRAAATVRRLADGVGPREATTAAYREAARLVRARLVDIGYAVRRQRFRVPAGVSWGVPVPAGRTHNVVATPPGFARDRPHLLVGAHLDTVPKAPGAEDNASGVAVLLELARLAARDGTRLPVVFVAFGAEEPRGEGDTRHHYGSRAYVARMPAAQRDALRAMVSLDRVGVGRVVPVCTGGLSPGRVRGALLARARNAGVPASGCGDNRSSDHWSFEKAGFAVARLGSTPYAAYHSADDVPSVVSRRQLGRVGRLAWSWLSG